MSFNYLNKDGLQYFWNKIKAKIGTATLTTTAQDLSGAVNELKSDLSYNATTWTPTSPRATISSSDCRYIRIGCLVYFFGSITFSATQSSQQALYLDVPSNMNIFNSSVFGGAASTSDHHFDLKTRAEVENRLYLYDGGNIVYATDSNIAGKRLLVAFTCIVSA